MSAADRRMRPPQNASFSLLQQQLAWCGGSRPPQTNLRLKSTKMFGFRLCAFSGLGLDICSFYSRERCSQQSQWLSCWRARGLMRAFPFQEAAWFGS